MAARTEAQMLQGEVASARKSVTDLQAQLRTIRLEAEIEKLRAMEQVRQQGDKEKHFLRLDKDKECERLTEQNDLPSFANLECSAHIVHGQLETCEPTVLVPIEMCNPGMDTPYTVTT